jgi:hypothetical protein
VFLAIHFGKKNLPTFLAAKDDKINAWSLPNVFVEGYWAQTHLTIARHFSTWIFGVDIFNGHYVLLRNDIKHTNPWCFCVMILGTKTLRGR